jgi:signal recognition particle GTPase
MDLVILIGLQGAGKTTFYHTHFATTHEHVSKDRLRHNKKPSRRQAQLIDDALRAGRSVVAPTYRATATHTIAPGAVSQAQSSSLEALAAVRGRRT